MVARVPKTSDPVIKKILDGEVKFKIKGFTLNLKPLTDLKVYHELMDVFDQTGSAVHEREKAGLPADFLMVKAQMDVAVKGLVACCIHDLTQDDAAALILQNGGAGGPLAEKVMDLCGINQEDTTPEEELPLESEPT